MIEALLMNYNPNETECVEKTGQLSFQDILRKAE